MVRSRTKATEFSFSFFREAKTLNFVHIAANKHYFNPRDTIEHLTILLQPVHSHMVHYPEFVRVSGSIQCRLLIFIYEKIELTFLEFLLY